MALASGGDQMRYAWPHKTARNIGLDAKSEKRCVTRGEPGARKALSDTHDLASEIGRARDAVV